MSGSAPRVARGGWKVARVHGFFGKRKKEKKKEEKREKREKREGKREKKGRKFYANIVIL